MAVTMNGVWKNFACNLFMIFVDLRKWMRSPNRSSAT